MSAKIVLLINPSREYTRRLLGGFTQYAHLHTSWTFYRPLEYRQPKAGRRLMPVLKALKPDGIFMREPREIEAIVKLGIPTVCSPYTRELIAGVANVITDHEAIGQMAAEHLRERGLRHFAYCGFDDWWWSCRRRDAFARRIEEAGFATDVYTLPRSRPEWPWDKELGRVVQWLQGLPKPVGVMTCNDDRGELVIEACRAAGLKVPDEVAVVGVDDDSLVCDLCSPPLSSVATNLHKTGYEAAATLDRMLAGRETGRPTLCIRPTHVATRQSTDILAIDDAEVAAALQFIRAHARRDVGVQQVADYTRLSRRMLEKRFRQTLGRSIHDEIQRMRLDLAGRMLMETQMSIAEIATALGFPNAAHVSRFFRRHTGQSPAQYRRQHLS